MSIDDGTSGLMRRLRASAALDRVVTSWSCLLAPPLALLTTVLAVAGVVPWYVPLALFASVIVPPLLLAPPPLAPESAAATLEGTLYDLAHAAVHDDDQAGDTEPAGGDRPR